MTKIVGILNITPDSFSDGGKYLALERSKKRVHELFKEGADIIDIGAESTRPQAMAVESEVEWERLSPLIAWLKDHYDAKRFSIDIRHGSVARHAVDAWSSDIMINDVTGLADPGMITAVLDTGVTVIAGHLPTNTKGDIAAAHLSGMADIRQVQNQIVTRYMQLVSYGIGVDKIIVDPGIGFGKTPTLNYELISFASLLPYLPVMVGYSRKRFLGSDRLNPARNVHYMEGVLRSRTAYVRVHDVAVHYAKRQEYKERRSSWYNNAYANTTK